MNAMLNLSSLIMPAGASILCMADDAVPGINSSGETQQVMKGRLFPGQSSHAVIIGLGKSGLATAVFLSKQGISVDVYDSSDQPGLALQLAQLVPSAKLHCGSMRVENWRAGSLLVVSPGVPLSHPDLAPLLTRGVKPLGDIELFAQCVKKPVIAITGSNGKTTVTALVGEILQNSGKQVAVGGNIGVPVLELLDDEKNDIYVLELSSFQLETTWSLKPAIAVVLNLAPDHMDRYQGMDDYINTKKKVYLNCQQALVNADEADLLGDVCANNRLISFSSTRPESDQDYGLVQTKGTVYLCRGDTKLISTDEIRLSGRHNHLNVLAAWSLASNVGIDDSDIKRAVEGFRGLPHRMEPLLVLHGVNWINDSKGTNVGASVAALQGLLSPVVLIAGGVAKDADFTPLKDAVIHSVKALILIGRDAAVIGDAIGGVVDTRYAKNMDDAVLQASALASEGDVVLLSPACASFDMYENYEQRGDDFRRLVGSLN